MPLWGIPVLAWWAIGGTTAAIAGVGVYNLTSDDGLAQDVIGDQGVVGWLSHPIMIGVLAVGALVLIKK